MTRFLFAFALLAPMRVVAQPSDATQSTDEDVVKPTQFDPTTCKRKKPTAPAPTNGQVAPIPVTWKDYEIAGDFIESPKTVRELLGPTLVRHRALTDDAREEVTTTATAFGYHVLGFGTRDTPTGTNAVLHIKPLPMVRRVDLDIKQNFFTTLVEDEVKRRMRVRTGSYLPWPRDERECVLREERRRIEQFLHDEGYFEAKSRVLESVDGGGVVLEIKIDLGPKYVTAIDRIVIRAVPEGTTLPVPEKDIREAFKEFGTCFVGRRRACIGGGRYTRTRHEASKQDVIEQFRKLGFPAVSVRITEPVADRRRKKVEFAVTIDPRRKVDVGFEGVVTFEENLLRAQLTFNQAASFDDVEKNASARAIATFLQSKGFFDARVTWYIPETAAKSELYQPLRFQIHQGDQRTVRTVGFAGNRAISADELSGSVATKPSRLASSILGTKAYATSAQLATDVDRIVTLYRQRGFRDVRARVSASTDPKGLQSAALTAALLSSDRGKDLHVLFAIDEGQPTLLAEVHVELGDKGNEMTSPEDRALCAEVLADLAQLFAAPTLANPATSELCIGLAPALEFRENEAKTTKDLLRDRLFSRGRPRADVEYEPVVLGTRRIAAVYKLRNTQQLKVGKIIVRGNFRTREKVIRGQLALKEGEPLTSDALAETTRALRNTALFDSVNIKLPDLETTSAGAVNAVVEVTERHDLLMRIDLEAGYSSYNGLFAKVAPTFKNLWGRGISLDVAGTAGIAGSDLFDGTFRPRQLSVESTMRFPRWLFPKFSPVALETELQGFHRRQDTPRFGILKTTGATLGLSRTYDKPRTPTRSARAYTVGGSYDFRIRTRNVDALRPIGADEDESQVPITTRTGSIGGSFEWEQRVDRNGNLQPLAPEGGFRLEARVSIASPIFLGEDTFLKVSGAGSKYWGIGSNLLLRADARYDHGFPLGGAALLPEVERFFAGGDTTVRGYEDDRLASEIVQVGLPPLANVDQIRILPAGGNIRVLASVDAQLRIYKLLSTAVFADAGIITNQWSTVTKEDFRPSVGMALVRLVTPFGAFAIERAVPLKPRLGDDPRGRWHISFAARAQF